MLKKWNELPPNMRTDEVRPYWETLSRKRHKLIAKRCIDVVLSAAGLVVLSIPMLAVAVYIKLDSPGPVFFRQERVTTCGRKFRIHKFRTMTADAEHMGNAVTTAGDARITKAGALLRRTKLDELPQLIDVLLGDMSLVGTRPETDCYVRQYKPEYMATLLLPAGITSEASFRFMKEEEMLSEAENIDDFYVNVILPEKMKWNLAELKSFSLRSDALTIARTIGSVLPGRGREYAARPLHNGRNDRLEEEA